jgi:hypothetical protein
MDWTTPMDASFLHLARPMNPMHIGGVSIFERGLEGIRRRVVRDRPEWGEDRHFLRSVRCGRSRAASRQAHRA